MFGYFLDFDYFLLELDNAQSTQNTSFSFLGIFRKCDIVVSV